jgi:hypothetical protein
MVQWIRCRQVGLLRVQQVRTARKALVIRRSTRVQKEHTILIWALKVILAAARVPLANSVVVSGSIIRREIVLVVIFARKAVNVMTQMAQLMISADSVQRDRIAPKGHHGHWIVLLASSAMQQVLKLTLNALLAHQACTANGQASPNQRQYALKAGYVLEDHHPQTMQLLSSVTIQRRMQPIALLASTVRRARACRRIVPLVHTTPAEALHQRSSVRLAMRGLTARMMA